MNSQINRILTGQRPTGHRHTSHPFGSLNNLDNRTMHASYRNTILLHHCARETMVKVLSITTDLTHSHSRGGRGCSGFHLPQSIRLAI